MPAVRYPAAFRFLRLHTLVVLFALVIASSSAWALEVAVTANNDPAPPGSLVYYHIIVSNTDNAVRNDITVQANVPDMTTLGIAVAQPNAECPNTIGSAATCSPGEVVTWSFDSLRPGESVVIEAPFQVASNTPDMRNLDLTVDVTYNSARLQTGPCVRSWSARINRRRWLSRRSARSLVQERCYSIRSVLVM